MGENNLGENNLEAYTSLNSVSWKISKTGSIAPVANFAPVEFNGIEYKKCSLITISNMKKISGVWYEGMTLKVAKANRGVKIADVYCVEDISDKNIISVPDKCPFCGCRTEIRHYKGRESLFCTNRNCKSRFFGRIFHYIGKDAMNITGLTERTVWHMIQQDLITKFRDFYYLKKQKAWLYLIPGFSLTKVDALLDTIEASRETTMERFLYALDIPRIGKKESKLIADHCENFDDFLSKWKNLYQWSNIEQIDQKTEKSLNSYAVKNWDELILLISELNIISS